MCRMLVATDLRKAFGGNVAVDDVSLQLGRGESVGLLGPNGAGKSTTIAMLSTLTKPDSGTVEYEGHDVLAGRLEWLEDLGVRVSPEARAEVDSLQSDGRSTVMVAVDGTLQGVLGIADTVRPSAADAIRSLTAGGVERVVLATGDGERAGRAIAAAAGIHEVHARQLPEHKLALIRSLQQEGHVVAFVGDGINDAPALAAADVGIAMGRGGTDVAVESADIALMSDDLTRIPEALQLSRKLLRIIRQNLAIAVGTVAVLLAAVLGGTLHMGGGMLVHEASLLVVVLNSLRLLRS